MADKGLLTHKPGLGELPLPRSGFFFTMEALIKWFKHDSRARNDAKLAKVIMKYGIEGYGLYFACLEIIAEELTPENFTFELEHDAELLANMFGMDTLHVERIMKYFVELGLFELSETTNRVACYKLARRLDNTMAQNPEIRKIIGNFKKLKEPESDFKKLKADKTRLDKKTSYNPPPKKAASKDEGQDGPNVLKLFYSMTGKQPNTFQQAELVRIKNEYTSEQIEHAFTEAGKAGAGLKYVDAVLKDKGGKGEEENEFVTKVPYEWMLKGGKDAE